MLKNHKYNHADSHTRRSSMWFLALGSCPIKSSNSVRESRILKTYALQWFLSQLAQKTAKQLMRSVKKFSSNNIRISWNNRELKTKLPCSTWQVAAGPIFGKERREVGKTLFIGVFLLALNLHTSFQDVINHSNKHAYMLTQQSTERHPSLPSYPECGIKEVTMVI